MVLNYMKQLNNVYIGLILGAIYSIYYVIVNQVHSVFYKHDYSSFNQNIDVFMLGFIPILFIIFLSFKFKKTAWERIGCFCEIFMCSIFGLIVSQLMLSFLIR